MQQQAAQTTVVAPISGVVAAVDLTPGQSGGAGAYTAVVKVLGAGGNELSTTVTGTDLPRLRVGEAAQMHPGGSEQTLTRTVVVLGL